jgi:predicted nucleic acid-binding Zn finger protein
MNNEHGTEERTDLRRRFTEFAKYGSKFEKALDTVISGGVKENRFLPSGRKFYSVVGNLGEEFIDPAKPYCSCSNFHFRVASGKEEICYHLLSFQMASRAGKVDVTSFDDEEFGPVVNAFFNDVFSVVNLS